MSKKAIQVISGCLLFLLFIIPTVSDWLTGNGWGASIAIYAKIVALIGSIIVLVAAFLDSRKKKDHRNV